MNKIFEIWIKTILKIIFNIDSSNLSSSVGNVNILNLNNSESNQSNATLVNEFNMPGVSSDNKKEKWFHILGQSIIPFFAAGFGMVAAGNIFKNFFWIINC